MTDPSTTTDIAAAVATSSALGADPGRTSSLPDVVEAPQPLEVAEAGEVLPTVATFEDGDGRVHYANPYAKGTLDRVTSGEWEPIDVDEPPFDPTNKRVKDVIAHLEQHAGDATEVERVKAAEAEGADRPTIAAWSPSE